MYTAFYKLSERPFELTPDLRFLYLSPKHREALAHLTYGVAERKVFVQLTGEVGTGKTLMLDALVHGLDATTKVARITNTTISRMDLLRALAWELGLPGTGRTKMEMLKEVSDCLSQWAADGRNAVFVIDEAQNLEAPLLEEIRLLSNLRSLARSTLQIVLAGQPELRTKLEGADLSAEFGQQLDNTALTLQILENKPIVLAFSSPAEPDPQGQYKSYQAMMAAVNARDWITGFSSRGFYPPVPLNDTTDSAYGKPVMDLLSYWYNAWSGGGS